ncbi:hypothetical protein C7441_10846 [Pseudaminobacter salicylatoxidans]|uniref:Sulphur transport domain-containing protein n=1 Tax=Pseudaminobacter salicylatoxidans TaxID=93369 RepID=A0A316CNC6_PSESE|nr:YeeE/YedE family protein [Pseudaminobacter salicylatoxidans]PWJ83654.1 hypothetical protein C7441_10846 [Pseudaminobacter salicylatoxidans]
MTSRPAQIAAALLAGVLFGFGLALSGMLDPARVQGFLDIFGNWDPSLAFVLGGAVVVAFAGVTLSKRMRRPVLDTQFHLPSNNRIDARLIAGSAIFGLGWGLAGFCPGPAVASLSLGLWQTMLFVAAMLAGMMVHDRAYRTQRAPAHRPA